MQRLFALVELLDEFLDAVLVIKLSGSAVVWRSSVKTISKPEFKNASSRNRWEMMSALNSIVSRKISGSGLNVISVPVFFALPMTSSFFVVLPRSNSM